MFTMLALVAALQAAPPIPLATIANQGLRVRADTLDGHAMQQKNRSIRYGWYVHAVTRTTIASRPVYLITMNYKGGDSFQADTVAVDSATLAPLWRRFYGRRDTAIVKYDGRRATGWSIQEGGKRVILNHTLSANAVDGRMLQALLPALPLTNAYSFSLPVFNVWTNTESIGNYTVSGPETVRIGERRYDTWKIANTADVQRWIERSTGALIQTHQPGSPKYGFWEYRRG